MNDRPAILVTGGAGYIGSHCCRALAAAGYHPAPGPGLRGIRRSPKTRPKDKIILYVSIIWVSRAWLAQAAACGTRRDSPAPGRAGGQAVRR